MGITETQSWRTVLALLAPRPQRRHQPNEQLLRVVHVLRENAVPFELYPEWDGQSLNFYDTRVYDATFGMRQLQISFTRKPAGFAVAYNIKQGFGEPWQSDEWTVLESADIGEWLLKRLDAIEWPRRSVTSRGRKKNARQVDPGKRSDDG